MDLALLDGLAEDYG